MILKLKPLDTIFFRDGRPFNRGDDTVGNGIFPPLPSVVFGALRSAYIFQNGGIEQFKRGEMWDKIGTHEDYPPETGFRIKSVFLEKTGVRYYPLPLDMGLLSYRKGEAVILDQIIADVITSVSGKVGKLIGTPNSDIIKAEQGEYFLAEPLLEYYFHGITNRHFPVEHINSFAVLEPKVGIQRENRTAKEGALYRVNMNRFIKEDIFLDIESSGLEANELTEILKIGGEGKSAAIEAEQISLEGKFQLDKIKNRITNSFKVYFTTPAIFKESGWKPEFREVEDKIKLIAAAVGKPVLVGGWDMDKSWHKPMYKAIPAGSVFYYELANSSNIEEVINKIHLKNHGERSEEGFGHAMVAMV